MEFQHIHDIDDPCLACRTQWLQATSLRDLSNLGARWLSGAIRYTPGYGGATPDPETELIKESLVGINNSGFWTYNSQPGVYMEGYTQRAWVSGRCSEEMARGLHVGLSGSELIVLATPLLKDSMHLMIPISRERERTCTFAGYLYAAEDLELYREDLSAQAYRELRSTWSVDIIDPAWGRNDLLWGTLIKALSNSEAHTLEESQEPEKMRSKFSFETLSWG